MNKWNNQHLTLDARILVSKTFIFSVFTHILNVTYITGSQIELIQKIVSDFVWKGRNKVCLSVMSVEYVMGGMKMLNVRNVVHGLSVKWMK